MVSIRYCEGDEGPIEESIEAAISDLGEGQHIDSQSQGRTYYGNEAFWAPEVRTAHHHTTASDIWAVGCLFLGMVRLHWDLVQPKIPGSTTREIQEWLLKIILACLETSPNDRLTARELAQELDVFEFPIEDEEREVKEARRFVAIEPEKLQRMLAERLTSKGTSANKEDDIVI